MPTTTTDATYRRPLDQWATRSADGRCVYYLLEADSGPDTGLFGVMVADFSVPEWGRLPSYSVDDMTAFYGFTSRQSALTWIEAHAATTSLAGFPHLRLARAWQQWIQRTAT